MKKNYFSYNLFFIIFLLFLKKNISTLLFSYPTAITLSDNNILVIETNGIYICDPNITTIISVEFNFTKEEDKIKNETNLSQVIIKRYSSFIYGLINYKIYIFNITGKLLYNSNGTEFEGYTPEYCTLAYSHNTGNLYYYIIGYFDRNNHLTLLLYEFDKLTNKNKYINYKNINILNITTVQVIFNLFFSNKFSKL